MLLAIKSPLIFTTRLSSNLITAMKNLKIIPDVIDNAPKEVVEIVYPCGDTVNLGNELTPRRVRDIPLIKWSAHSDNLYTLCLVDPDAPSREDPKFREWNHWLVGNIPGDDIEQGETLAAYIGSAPPKGTGLHRYVFLVFKQENRFTFGGPRLGNTSAERRGGFTLRKFVGLYNLGDPVAGNFFQAQYDDYVPVVNRKLGVKD